MARDVIKGIGVDAVPVGRMRVALDRTPGLAQRVFTRRELDVSASRPSREASLAARFAAKEACRKALGATLPWKAVEVVSEGRAPKLRVEGYDELVFHVSLTHTDEIAMAVVIAET